nr:MAG TPA: hypothetical protein [Caudoviricetes sp.]DAO89505.1 MAG TPA: hypothetical protein [Caudoviricetes sp.]DAQ21654.1 MAG TPA: hypothetical protein [Caudoviricetes sp.]
MCVVRKSGGNIISFYIEESRVFYSLFYYSLFETEKVFANNRICAMICLYQARYIPYKMALLKIE